jgi:hypothetical protein
MEEIERNRKFKERLDNLNSLMGITESPKVNYMTMVNNASRRTQTSTRGAGKPRDKDNVESKFDEKLKFFIIRVCEKRPRLQFDKIYVKSQEVISQCNLKIERGKDNTNALAVYSLVIASRLLGEFIDLNFLAQDLELCPKKINKYVERHFPPINSPHEIDKRIIKLFFSELNPRSLCMEYIEYFHRSSEPSPIGGDGIDKIISEFKLNMNMLTHQNVCDEEKQFCVTPSKIVVYTIMDYYREISNQTDKEMVQIVSKNFGIPKVTLEKMKRILTKLRKMA